MVGTIATLRIKYKCLVSFLMNGFHLDLILSFTHQSTGIPRFLQFKEEILEALRKQNKNKVSLVKLA